MTPTDLISFGPFRLDARKLVLWRGTEVVPLPLKAVTLLATLVRAAGDVVSKDDLLARVWPDTIVEESNLTVTMSALRKALGRRSDGRPYIETLSRRGYRFLASSPEAEVASLLDLGLGPRARKALKQRPTESLEAYQAMTRGVHFWQRLTPASLFKAVANFEEAAAHDPSYALAEVGRASTYIALAAAGGMAPRHAWALATEAIERAHHLDPRLAVAQLARGYVKALAEWNFDAADAAMRRALTLDPRSVNAHQWYAVFLYLLGRREEAERHAKQTLALNPVSIVGHALRGLPFSLDGDHARALAEYSKAIEIEPEHFLGLWGRSVSLIRLGRHQEGLAILSAAATRSEGSVPAHMYLAWALARGGRGDEARAVLAGLELIPGVYVSPFLEACVRLAFGEKQAALDLLEKAAEDRDPWLAFLLVDPKLDELRDLSRFNRLKTRVFGRLAVTTDAAPAGARKSFGKS